MLLGIHHIGIAVTNLDEAARRYLSIFGIQAGDIYNVPERGLRIALLDVGNTKLELVERTSTEAVSAQSIESHGERITHICFEVDDINKELESLSAKGIPLRDKMPRQGITGIIAYLHPEAMNGVAIELIDKASAI